MLINKDFDLKICDFGLATVKTEKINKNYDLTGYVVTLVGSELQSYSSSIKGRSILQRLIFGPLGA